MTRFFGTAGDYVSDFFGGNTSNKKKQPNDGILINRKNDEKAKKKPEFVKKTPKNTASKVKADDDENEGSVLDTLEETIENLAADEEQPSTTEKDEATETDNNDTDNEKDEDDEVSDPQISG